MDNPSTQLASKVIERLVDEKLLLAADGKDLLAKLAEGNMRAEDWRLSVEHAAKQEALP